MYVPESELRNVFTPEIMSYTPRRQNRTCRWESEIRADLTEPTQYSNLAQNFDPKTENLYSDHYAYPTSKTRLSGYINFFGKPHMAKFICFCFEYAEIQRFSGIVFSALSIFGS